jgi:hypothetical protein
MYGLWGLGLMMLTKGFIVVDAEVNVQDLEAVAREVGNNVDWRYDVTVVDGPVDQLDHSAIEDSYGGKIGIDATRSTRPEFMTPFPVPAPVPAEAVTKLVGDNWQECYQTLLVGLDKTRIKPKDAMRALWELCPDYNIVILDHQVDVHNLSDVGGAMRSSAPARSTISQRRGCRAGTSESTPPARTLPTDTHAAGRKKSPCHRKSSRWWTRSGSSTELSELPVTSFKFPVEKAIYCFYAPAA